MVRVFFPNFFMRLVHGKFHYRYTKDDMYIYIYIYITSFIIIYTFFIYICS